MDKELLKDWFHFHQSGRRGILVLIWVIIGCILLRVFLPLMFVPKDKNLDEISKLVHLWALQENNKKGNRNTGDPELSLDRSGIHQPYFLFDPNQTTVEEWKLLDLNDGQIRSIQKFLGAGGKFRTRSDFAKLYVINDQEYDALYPFIKLPDTLSKALIKPYEPFQERINKSVNHEKIDLNLADSITLLSLPGIGPFYAGKIIEYRNNLGGFYNREQLLEIWKMKPETIEALRDYISIDLTAVRKIHINHCTAEELSLHPYLTALQARTLVSFRQKHGPFIDSDGLLRCLVIDEVTLRKILPYLSVS